MNGKIIISGTGCALADYLYTDVNFHSPGFLKFSSRTPGDGGLSPGKLVFTEDLETFAKIPYTEILADLTNQRAPDSFNIGGPAVVSLIHAAQLLEEENAAVNFYGGLGKDQTAGQIIGMVQQTPLNISHYRTISEKPTPFTDVLSDPCYHNNHGERTFINNIGAAWDYDPGLLEDSFFTSDMVCFGGTALVPQLHQNLTDLLLKAKKNRCITVVNTVFDFLNEKRAPGKKWSLISSYNNFDLIDLLIMDKEEALRISGEKSLHLAAIYFMESGVASFVITNGAEDLLAFSNGEFFRENVYLQLPVSSKVREDLQSGNHPKGDTTGCGDNFAGGMIASIGRQLNHKKSGELDIIQALALGTASGGFACFYKGGTYLEQTKGEKARQVQRYYEDYLNQLSRHEPTS